MYVDGFVLPVPKKNLAAYKKMATLGSKIWREHGALEYRECIGDDIDVKGVMPFAKTVTAKPSELIVFAWITFKSRAHRDQVNAKVMEDPRMKAPDKPPFDISRMAYGGFKVVVGA